MIRTMKVKSDNMYRAAEGGFINATDLADYLTKRGVPFRSAYKIVGEIVSYCISRGYVLDNMPLEEYKKYSEIFDADLYDEISLKTCVAKRISAGSTGYASVEGQISDMKSFLQSEALN